MSFHSFLSAFHFLLFTCVVHFISFLPTFQDRHRPTPSLNFPPKTHLSKPTTTTIPIDHFSTKIPRPGYCCQPPNHHVVHLQVTVVQVHTYHKAYLAAAKKKYGETEKKTEKNRSTRDFVRIFLGVLDFARQKKVASFQRYPFKKNRGF